MSNVCIALTKIMDKGTPWGVVVAEDSNPPSDYKVNPITSQSSAIVVPSDGAEYFWSILSLSGDAWVAFAKVPVAAVGIVSRPCASGAVRLFRAIPGDKCAVINAT